jgi:Fe-S-cluster containining protein
LNRYFNGYLHLREEIDNECSRLEKLHKNYLSCAPGCTGCCVNFNIFPVEFYSIREENSKGGININKSYTEGNCVFLVDNLCSIYGSRPIICRTHGLPLLAMGEEEWELSHCELNFKENPPEFNESNTFQADRYNSKLFILNRKFIQALKEKQYNEFDLIPLSNLIKLN